MWGAWGGGYEFSAFAFSWKSIRLSTISVCCLISDTPDESLVSLNTSSDVHCHSDRFQRLPRKHSTFSFDTSLCCCSQLHIYTNTHALVWTHPYLAYKCTSPLAVRSSCKCSVPVVFTVHCRHKSRLYCWQACFLDARGCLLAQLLTRLQQYPGSVFTLFLINSHQSSCLLQQYNILISASPTLLYFISYTNRSSRFPPPAVQLNPR